MVTVYCVLRGYHDNEVYNIEMKLKFHNLLNLKVYMERVLHIYDYSLDVVQTHKLDGFPHTICELDAELENKERIPEYDIC